MTTQAGPKTAQDPSKTTLLYLTAGGSFPTGRSWGGLGVLLGALGPRLGRSWLLLGSQRPEMRHSRATTRHSRATGILGGGSKHVETHYTN